MRKSSTLNVPLLDQNHLDSSSQVRVLKKKYFKLNSTFIDTWVEKNVRDDRLFCGKNRCFKVKNSYRREHFGSEFKTNKFRASFNSQLGRVIEIARL
jgi:hypothetical protein